MDVESVLGSVEISGSNNVQCTYQDTALNPPAQETSSLTHNSPSRLLYPPLSPPTLTMPSGQDTGFLKLGGHTLLRAAWMRR